MNLKDEILSKMPNNLSDLEKARYLYIELGKKVSFSTKFQNADDKQYMELMNAKVDINTFNKNQVNCIMWSQLYSQLLTSVGVNNRIIDVGHKFVNFFIDDVRWIADATYEIYSDLARIHNNDYTESFGIALFQERSNENIIRNTPETQNIIDKIDNKLFPDNENRKKLNELKELLTKIKNNEFDIQELTNTTVTKENEILLKLEYLFAKLGYLNDGYYESKDFVRDLESFILTKEELDKVKGIELKRTNRDKEIDIVQCICVCLEDKIHYYLLAPNLPIRKSNEYEITMLSALGYGIDERTIPGIDFPKNFVPGKISTSKYTIKKIPKKYLTEGLIDYNTKQNKPISF